MFNLACLFCYFLTKDSNILHFISLFTIISYTSNGIQKLDSKNWRKGVGLEKVLKTRLYGNKFLADIIKSNRTAYFILSWGIILFQLTFIFYLVNNGFCIFYLVAGIVFHIILAVFMGLRDFLFAFLSSYPILFFTFKELHLFFN
jgi:hypothetical protein